jgi:hypothetical protein
MEDGALTKRELRPFGIEVTASAPVQVESIRTQQLKEIGSPCTVSCFSADLRRCRRIP